MSLIDLVGVRRAENGRSIDVEMGHSISVAPVVRFLTILLGVGLVHSVRSSGFNVSAADVFFVLLVLLLGLRNQIQIPPFIFVFASLLTVNLGIATIAVAPSLFHVYESSFVAGYLKLVIVFGYLVLGISLARLDLLEPVFRAAYITSAFVGYIGLVHLVFSTPIPSALIYGSSRYRGLMTDPNFFAVTSAAALALVMFDDNAKLPTKLFYSLGLVGGVLASGSKTGTIALVITAAVISAIEIWRSRASVHLFALVVASVFTVVAIRFLLGTERVQQNLAEIAGDSGPIARVLTLFNDAQGAIGGGGSGRDKTWSSALELIEKAPLTGVGLGTYSSIVEKTSGTAVLAHNTYLQVAAEWGLVFAGAFFVAWMVILIVPVGAETPEWTFPAAKLALLAFSIGGLGLSLNNSRFFWFLFGALLYGVAQKRNKRRHSARLQE